MDVLVLQSVHRLSRRRRSLAKCERLCVVSMLSVIHHLLGDGVGGSNDARADGGEPGVLLVLRVSDEDFGLSHAGNLERTLLSSLIHRAGDGETVPQIDHPPRLALRRDVGVEKPKEFTFLEDEPAAAPRGDDVASLVQPPRAHGIAPKLYTTRVVVLPNLGQRR